MQKLQCNRQYNTRFFLVVKKIISGKHSYVGIICYFCKLIFHLMIIKKWT